MPTPSRTVHSMAESEVHPTRVHVESPTLTIACTPGPEKLEPLIDKVKNPVVGPLVGVTDVIAGSSYVKTEDRRLTPVGVGSFSDSYTVAPYPVPRPEGNKAIIDESEVH